MTCDYVGRNDVAFMVKVKLPFYSLILIFLTQIDYKKG